MRYWLAFLLIFLFACTPAGEKTASIPVENMSLSIAVLSNISIADIPAQYLQKTEPLPFEKFPKTEAIIETELEWQGRVISSRDVIHLAAADPAECEQVRGAKAVSEHNDLYAMCITKVARISGVPEHCSSLTGEARGNCISRLAENRSNVAGCFLIPRGEKHYDGEELFTDCIVNVVKKSPSLEGCALLGNTVDGNLKHKESCLIYVARHDPDAVDCATLQIPEARDLCFSAVAAAKKDLGACADISPGEDRDQCLGYAASLTGDCSQLAIGPASDICYDRLARTTKDTTYCEHITQRTGEFFEITQLRCYQSLVFENRDVTTCGPITDAEVREACYHQFSAFPNTLAECQSITEFPVIQANCILNLAGQEDDKTLCDAIDPSIEDRRRNVKEFCLQVV